MIPKRNVIAFVASMVLGGTGGVAHLNAAWTSNSVADCQPVYAGTSTSSGGVTKWNHGENWSATQDLDVMCAINETSARTKDTFAPIMTVMDRNTLGSVSANACTSSETSFSWSCGPPVGTFTGGLNPTGVFNITFGTATSGIWASGANYPFIMVRLPPTQSGNASGIHGYWY